MDALAEEDEVPTPAQKNLRQCSQLFSAASQRRPRQEEDFPSLRPPAKRMCQMVDPSLPTSAITNTKKSSRKIVRFNKVDGKKLPVFEVATPQPNQSSQPATSGSLMAPEEKSEKRPPPITILKVEECQNVRSTLEANKVPKHEVGSKSSFRQRQTLGKLCNS